MVISRMSRSPIESERFESVGGAAQSTEAVAAKQLERIGGGGVSHAPILTPCPSMGADSTSNQRRLSNVDSERAPQGVNAPEKRITKPGIKPAKRLKRFA